MNGGSREIAEHCSVRAELVEVRTRFHTGVARILIGTQL
jgi:hypothetical protein